jgi:transposase
MAHADINAAKNIKELAILNIASMYGTGGLSGTRTTRF